MAFIDCHFFSETLGLSVAANVVLPQRRPGASRDPARPHPVLYLLHGLSDDHTVWMRRTSIERYATAKGLAVVMPAVARSFYQDMAAGLPYWTYISQELPVIMESFFPLSRDRSERFAAGLSMGGYGALRLALSSPERFAAAASFSGALDIVRAWRTAGRPGSRLSPAETAGIHDPAINPAGTAADLWHLARQAAASHSPLPALYLSCGTEDPLLPDTRSFRQHLQSLSWQAAYREAPGGHEWSFWDAEIQRALDWLPLPPSPDPMFP